MREQGGQPNGPGIMIDRGRLHGRDLVAFRTMSRALESGVPSNTGTLSPAKSTNSCSAPPYARRRNRVEAASLDTDEFVLCVLPEADGLSTGTVSLAAFLISTAAVVAGAADGLAATRAFEDVA